MNLLKLAFVFAAAFLFLVACATNQTTNDNSATNAAANSAVAVNQTPAAPADELASAKKIYNESCVGCHRENGEGGIAEFNGEKVKVPSYKSKGAMAASDAKLADYIRNGEEGEMPAFKDKLNEEEITALVKLIRRDFQGK